MRIHQAGLLQLNRFVLWHTHPYIMLLGRGEYDGHGLGLNWRGDAVRGHGQEGVDVMPDIRPKTHR
jgi:hypothetical protein